MKSNEVWADPRNVKVFAVYDSKAEAYMQPFFMQSKGQAIRSWQDVVEDEKTQFAKHPGDFTLFEIGEYNEEKGLLIPHQQKINLGSALETRAASQNSRASKALSGNPPKLAELSQELAQ